MENLNINIIYDGKSNMYKLNSLVGQVEVYFIDDVPHITGTLIRKEYMNLGYAKILYKHIFNFLVNIGYEYVCSDTIITSPYVHLIWKKFGAEFITIDKYSCYKLKLK